MSYTAIPVTTITNYLSGTAITSSEVGDAVNGNSVDLSSAPKLMLAVSNTHAAPIDITLSYPASVHTFGQALTKTVTITNGKVRFMVLDIPPDMRQSGNVLYITSADGNYNLIRFRAYTWQESKGRN